MPAIALFYAPNVDFVGVDSVQVTDVGDAVTVTDRAAVRHLLSVPGCVTGIERLQDGRLLLTLYAYGSSRVWISSDYGNGGGLVEIGADGRAQEIYFTKDMRNHHSSSVLIGDYLYGFSGGILTAMKFDTGEVAWKDRSVGKGSLVYADGHLYALSENGVVGLVEATPTAYKEKGRFRIPQDSLPTWTHPVVAGGRLYLRDQDTIYSYNVREK